MKLPDYHFRLPFADPVARHRYSGLLLSHIHIKLSLEPSMLGDLIVPVDSLSISLGMGLSITLKAGVELLRWLWGAVAQWSEHLHLKQEALGSIPGGCLGFFFFQLADLALMLM